MTWSKDRAKSSTSRSAYTEPWESGVRETIGWLLNARLGLGRWRGLTRELVYSIGVGGGICIYQIVARRSTRLDT
jgi:hypothetical protein